MVNFSPIAFSHDAARLLCPLAMRPLALYFLARYSSGRDKALLLQTQREAHRVGYVSDVPEGKPLLGTPSHCLIGLPPPWRYSKTIRMHFIPGVIDLIVRRHLMKRDNLCVPYLDEAVAQAALEYGIPMRRYGTVFNQTLAPVHDVFVVYHSLVKGRHPNPETMAEDIAVAEIEVFNTLRNADSAQDMREIAEGLAAEICEAIDIEFN